MLHESGAGALIGGVSFHVDTASADISSRFGKGDIDTTGYGFEGTLTWYGNSGFYVDTQAGVTWYSSDIKSSTLRTTLADGNDGFGYGFSVEAGQKIALTSQWSLTPQAQLAYSSVRFDSFTDQYGADVSLDDGDSLTGRLGISADYDGDWKNASGKINRVKLYGIANSIMTFSIARMSMFRGPASSARTRRSGAVLAGVARSVGRTTGTQSTAKPLPAPASRTSATATPLGRRSGSACRSRLCSRVGSHTHVDSASNMAPLLLCSTRGSVTVVCSSGNLEGFPPRLPAVEMPSFRPPAAHPGVQLQIASRLSPEA
jgi:fibronectin-binding autotransporter adhesin